MSKRIMEAMNPADLSQYLIPNAGQQFNGNDFRQLREPGVYVFVCEGKALYVGMASMLLRRVGSWHKQAAKAIEQCDQVLLYPCKSVEAAQDLEKLLIKQLKPANNTHLKYKEIADRLGLERPGNYSPCKVSVTQNVHDLAV